MAKQFLNINEDYYTGKRIQGEHDSQDSYFGFDNSKPDDFLMILADGGGYESGTVASSLAIKTFKNSYHAISGSVAKRLQYALQQTTEQLALKKKSEPKLTEIGCTLVGVALNDEQMEWISVGDSPLWLYNARRLKRLNANHSMRPILQKQLQHGKLTPEAAIHPNRHTRRAALTGKKIELIEQSSEPLELYPGDFILLASDGIFTLSESEISNLLQNDLSAKELVHQMLSAIQKKGNLAQDNTIILVVKMPDEMEAAKQPKRWRWQTSVLSFLLILSAMLLFIFQR